MSAHHNLYDHLELLTAYADGELHGNEKQTASELIASNDRARVYVEQQMVIKEIVKRACCHGKAPDHLRQRCLDAIAAGNSPSVTPSKSTSSLVYTWLAAAAVVLFAVTIIFRLQNQEPVPNVTITASFPVEDHVYRHFDGEKPKLHTSFTTVEAEAYIKDAWDLEITVPSLEGTTFSGFAYTEFVPGFHTPVLVYTTESESETILIFAFDVPHMKGDVALVRDPDAVNTCIDHDSIHIKDINGKHVVSWLWEDTWYAGISNHHGEILASRLPINR